MSVPLGMTFPPILRQLNWLGLSAYTNHIWRNYFALPPAKCCCVDKINGENDFADCELAWTNINGRCSQIRHNGWHVADSERDSRREHPTKPIAVMVWAIERANSAPQQTILDPFMGSGTTG